MHPDAADAARPERASKYVLLVSEDPAGDPVVVEIQVRRDGHEVTMGTRDKDESET